MKKLCLIPAALLLLIGLTGCFGGTSIVRVTPAYEGQLSSTGEPVVANIEVENRGQFLFNWIPVWAGDPWSPNLRRYKLWKNTLKPGYNQMLLENARKKADGHHLSDIELKESSTGAFSLWLLWNRTWLTSAVAIASPKQKKAEDDTPEPLVLEITPNRSSDGKK